MSPPNEKQQIRKLQRAAAYREFLYEIKEILIGSNRCFISYAWDDNSTSEGQAKNKIWHERLSKIKNDFKLLGVEVFLDIYDMNHNMNTIMSSNIEKSDVIFLIGTPRLKVRLMNDSSPAAFEYRHIQEKLARSPTCILAPLLFEGDYGDALPEGLSSEYLIRDMKSDEAHEHIMTTLSDPMGLIPCVFRLNQRAAEDPIREAYETFYKKLSFKYQLIDRDYPPTPVIPEKLVPLSTVLAERVLSNELCYFIAFNIATNLSFIHQHLFQRMQLFSSQTIMLDINHQFKPKIIGFQLSKTSSQGEASKSENIYNLGIIFWQIMTGKTYDQTVDKNSPTFLSQVPPIYANLIRLCLSNDPSQRPNAQGIVDYLKRNESVCTDNSLFSTFESPAQQSEIIFASATKAKEANNLTQAFKLYLLAADLGSIPAEANVGSVLVQGLGNVPIDKPRAFKHLLSAAMQGEPRAQNNVARMYEKGDGIQENRAEAISWYSKAAQQNDDPKAKQVAVAKLQQFRMNK